MQLRAWDCASALALSFAPLNTGRPPHPHPPPPTHTHTLPHTNILAPPSPSPALQVSLINLNDGTCAGMFHPGLRAMTVQSHPEASPGPHDSDVAFTEWIELVKAEAAAAKA